MTTTGSGLVPPQRAPRADAPLSGHARRPFRGPDAQALAAATSNSALLDVDGARLWFALYEQITEQALYTYQLPSAGSTGASKRVLGSGLVEFSSYGYLGLNGHRRIVEATLRAVEAYGTSSGGVRMLTAPRTSTSSSRPSWPPSSAKRQQRCSPQDSTPTWAS